MDLKLAGISALLIALTIAAILNVSWPAQQASAHAPSPAETRTILIESPVPF
jgi:hypothetical protein